MQVPISSTYLAFVRLFNSSTGLGQSGVAFGSVTATYLKSDGTTGSITVNGSTWTAVTTGAFASAGVYTLSIPSGTVNIAGTFGYCVTATGCNPYVGWVEIMAQLPSDVYSRVGAPAGASVSADVAAIKSDTGAINTKIGTPAVTVSTDIANVRGSGAYSLTDLAGAGFTAVSDTLHQIAGTISGGGGAPSAGTIAAAVWDEVLTGHVTANSAGVDLKLSTAIKAKTDNLPSDPASQAAILGPQSINLSSIAGGAAFSSIADNLHQINANINIIPDGVWSTVLTGYTTINTAGKRINDINTKTQLLPTSPASTTDVNNARDSIKGTPALAIGDIAGTGWSSTTDTLKAMSAAISGGGISPSVISDAVWNASRSSYIVSGSMGEGMGQTFTKTQALPNDPARSSDVSAAITSIKGLDNRNLTQLAGTGWVSGTDNLHQIYIKIPSAGPSASQVAAEVWDTDMTTHNITGSSGNIIQETRDASDRIQQLSEGRWKIFTTGADANRMVLYDGSGTIIQKWSLRDASGNPTTSSIYERVPLLTIP